MLNRSASLGMSTSVLKALPGKLDIKRHSPSILYKQLKCTSGLVGNEKLIIALIAEKTTAYTSDIVKDIMGFSCCLF